MTTETVNPYPSQTPVDTSVNPAGRVSLILAISVVIVGLIQQALSYFLPLLFSNLAMGYSTLGVAFAGISLVVGVLSAVALITGIIGLRRVGAPKAAAGAGTAIGASSLLSVLVGFVLQVVASLAF